MLGLGYVGLPVALAAADAGHDVLGYDIDQDRLADIRSGRTDLVDLDHDRVAAHLKSGSLTLSANPMDLAAAHVYLICVPTPLADGSPDLNLVLAAIDTVADTVRPGDLVILESTTWPGTTVDILAPRLAKRSGLLPGSDIHLVFSPERIDPGNQDYPLTRIPKLIGGFTRRDGELAAAFYRTFLESVHIVSGPSEAEMAKILENTFRHVNLALVNELAMMCSTGDINLREAITAAATKPFGFMPFYPGPGVGGHCIPIDPIYLNWSAKRTGFSLRLIDAAEQVNRAMPTHVVNRITMLLNNVAKPVRGSGVLLLGISYKPGVADVRESSAFPIAEKLVRLGAHVRWHDPLVRGSQDLHGLPRLSELSGAVVSEHDLTLLHTPHPVYTNALLEAAPLLLDPHGALAAATLPNVFDL
ncbi:nucleotide sugar dehydrogenase [Nocardia anaemiae]|uniref:nucleotide sugar dehydrogenase n=1 Tax=Nocardia anaemiae TaxID=263910 RepID=UPI001471B6A8|nr:nucleotide sugar dehydrogenase [Nocardia anaemiae]